MKLVSGAKLRQAQIAMEEFLPYARKYREMLHSLAAQTDGGSSQPLLTAREAVATRAVLAVSSDRGLCGSFNGGLQKEVANYVERHDTNVVVFPVGRRVTQFVVKQGFTVGEEFGEVIPARGL